MSTDIRPVISKKSPYWISRHRYYELKHFCLQYPEWQKEVGNMTYIVSKRYDNIFVQKNNYEDDPTSKVAIKMHQFVSNMNMVNRAALSADKDLCEYILLGVTKGITYTALNANYSIPCCKDTYYDAYRRFFYILSEMRK